MPITTTDNQSSLADAMRADAVDVARRSTALAEQYLKDDFATGESHRWPGDFSTFEPYAERAARTASERERRLAQLRAERDAALAKAMRRAQQ